MIQLSKFIPTKGKEPKHFLYSPDVPEFWNGYYAIFKPKEEGGLWVKRWFASDKSKTFQRAYLTIEVKEGHKHWNEWLTNRLLASA